MALPLPRPQQTAPQQQPSAPPQEETVPQQAPMQDAPEGIEGQDEQFDPSSINGEELQMLLFSRIQQLEPDEARTFASLVTPETVIPLFKVLPELGILFDEILTQRQRGVGQEAGGMPQGMPQQQGQEQPMEEESYNPLVDDNISRGLMG